MTRFESILCCFAALIGLSIAAPAAGSACCFPDTTCEDLPDQGACEAAGGVWLPDNSCPCAILFRACCFEDGTCEDLLDDNDCEDVGGNWQPFAVCDDEPCPQSGIRVCCLQDDTCELTTEPDCNAQGGSWLAAVTSCELNPCTGGGGNPACPGEESCFETHISVGCDDEDCCGRVCDTSPSCCAISWDGGCVAFANNLCDNAPTGACCVPGEGCVIVDVASCDDFTGVWQGPDTVCEEDTCPDLGPSGACCVNEACYELPEAACSLLLGEWNGGGTSCLDTTCAPEGACCIDGSCETLTESDCLTSGGEYQGDGTACTGDLCDDSQPLGACCAPTGACYELTASACDRVGGAWQGADTLCAVVDCPQPGACCIDRVTCMDMTDVECDTAGGTFQSGTTCYPGLCLPEVAPGACCVEDDCVTVYRLQCLLLGGTWLGDGTSCATVTCGAEVCQGDTNRDGVVDDIDLSNVIEAWKSDGVDNPLAGDFTDVVLDGIVNVDDLVAVILMWGDCSTDVAEYFTDWSGGADGWVGSGDLDTEFTLDAGTWFAPNSPGPSFHSDFLTSPVFVVEDAGSLAFEFTHYYDMEEEFDGGVVEINVNGGGFNHFALPDYDMAIDSNSPINGLDAYTGTNLIAHLSGRAIGGLTNGDTIQFRFHQGDDVSVVADGWYIDDFSLFGASIP
jgi:hypothetical protein